MSVKYYVDVSGNYMGALDGVTGVDISAWTEVPSAPDKANDTWDGAMWLSGPAYDDSIEIDGHIESDTLGVSSGDRYTLPDTDGASGQVLTTDGLGNLTWTDKTP